MRNILFACTALCVQAAWASENPVDRWAAAVGGRAKLAAVTSTYREATIEVAGNQGQIKIWRTPDGKYRKEERVGPYAITEIFDGTAGTVQRAGGPPQRMGPAELSRARSTAYANANAVFYAVFPERRRGTLSTEGDTIVIRPEGGIDWRITLDPKTSLPQGMVHEESGQTISVSFSAYEVVDGITLEKELRRSTGDQRMNAVIRFTKTEINPAINAATFALDPAALPAG